MINSRNKQTKKVKSLPTFHLIYYRASISTYSSTPFLLTSSPSYNPQPPS